MSQNYEILKVLRESDESLRLHGLLSVKLKDEKFKNFSPLAVYDIFYDGIEKMKNFQLYSDDVLMCGYMRSGTTLMQEMIWLILNDFDFDGAKRVIRSERFPNLEGYDQRQQTCGKSDYTRLEDLPRPRAFKTHCPAHFLPTSVSTAKPRIIHVSRDVKDVVPSMFHYLRDMFNETDMNFEEFLEKFMRDEILFTPYREHCVGYFTFEHENIMYLTYEWVVGNIDEAIKRVTRFLGKVISEENAKLLREHLKFDSMKNNPACNNEEWTRILNKSFGNENAKTEGHIRKGRVGGHTSELTPEMAEKLDAWMSKSLKMK